MNPTIHQLSKTYRDGAQTVKDFPRGDNVSTLAPGQASAKSTN